MVKLMNLWSERIKDREAQPLEGNAHGKCSRGIVVHSHGPAQLFSQAEVSRL